jgi:hypothetical protein
LLRGIERGHGVCRGNIFLVKQVRAILGIRGVKHVPRVFGVSHSVDRVMKTKESGACLAVIYIWGRKIHGADRVNIVRVSGILGGTVIKEVQICDELRHRRGTGDARVLATGRKGELFVLRFDLADDLGVLCSKGLGEAMIDERMELFNGVTREATSGTLWVCRVISRFAVDVTYNVFQCAIHSEHVDSYGAQLDGTGGIVQMDSSKVCNRRADFKNASGRWIRVLGVRMFQALLGTPL